MSLTSFYKYWSGVGQETVSRTFESFLNKIDTTMPTDSITINDLKETFFP